MDGSSLLPMAIGLALLVIADCPVPYCVTGFRNPDGTSGLIRQTELWE
jgi:hypothetical protein